MKRTILEAQAVEASSDDPKWNCIYQPAELRRIIAGLLRLVWELRGERDKTDNAYRKLLRETVRMAPECARLRQENQTLLEQLSNLRNQRKAHGVGWTAIRDRKCRSQNHRGQPSPYS